VVVLLKEAAAEPPLPRVVVTVVVIPLQPLRMAVAVKEAAVYSAAVVPRPRLPTEAAETEAAETEAHSRLLVAELRRPRLPVTAVVAALVVATKVAVATMVAPRAMPPDEPPIRSLLRFRKNNHRERRNRWGVRLSPFRKPPPRPRSPAGVPLSR
jgi:hypothetical protein